MRLFRATLESRAPIPDLESKILDGVGTSMRFLGEKPQAQIQLASSFNMTTKMAPSQDMVTFFVDVNPNSPYPMSKVHAMASQIHYCLAAIISKMDRKFSVTTKVYERELEYFMRAIPQDESFYEPKEIWLLATNRRVILDIAEWIRTIGPIYEACFVTLERYTNDDELFNYATIESESIKTALSRDNTNLVVLSPSEKGVVKRTGLEDAESDGARIPCKTQGSLAPANLHLFPFIDIQKAGLGLNHFVILPDYHDSVSDSRDGHRVFVIIPSFLKYPGLVSDSVLRGGNQVGSMHCAIDEGKTYQMSFMFPCGLSKGLKMPGGKTCVPDEAMYKTKMFHGQKCKFPTEEGVEEDSGCCVSSTSWTFLERVMTMYARKTTGGKKYNYLKDIYEWYKVSVGPIRAHDTSLSLIYPPEREDHISEYKAFAYMEPVVKKLHILYPDSLKVSSFAHWYREVSSVFRIRERYDVTLTFTMEEDDRHIDNEYMIWVIQNTTPKRNLTLYLPGALFVDNDPGPILNAMYDTENFHLIFDTPSLLDERVPDPTNKIVKLGSGFVEDDDAQDLSADEENPDNFRHIRYFEKGHMKVKMTLTFDHLQLDVTTSYAFV